MPGHQLHLLRGHLVGDRHRLLRVARVVAHGQHKLLAQHAAGLVDVGHRLFGARLHLLPERGIFAGHRSDRRDLNLRRRRRGGQR